MNVKRMGIMAFFFVCSAAALSAQQHITNFGIVDTDKVYEHFFQKSSAVKSYDTKRAEMQDEVNKRTQELRDLKEKKDSCDKIGDKAGSNKYTAEIKTKTESLRDYTAKKNLELKNLKKTLSESNEFYINLSKAIQRVAENSGLSMVLSLQGDNSILWYSHTVDITDKVIQALEK